MTRFLKLSLLAIGIGAVLAPTIVPASAQEWRERERARIAAAREHEREREWRAHERRVLEWRRAHEATPAYGYAYAPPPVVYTPPPPASFSLTIPLNIR